MTLGNIGILLIAVALAASGQLVLKNGMNLAKTHAQTSGRSLAVVAVTSPWIIGGLLIFGVSAVAWLVTLSRVPLSIAYPFNALGYVVILVASSVILHERTNVWTWLGTVLVVGGLLVVVTTAPGSLRCAPGRVCGRFSLQAALPGRGPVPIRFTALSQVFGERVRFHCQSGFSRTGSDRDRWPCSRNCWSWMTSRPFRTSSRRRCASWDTT